MFESPAGAREQPRFGGLFERFPLKRAIHVVYPLFPGLGKLVYKIWYHYITKWDHNALATFMNFGYADLLPGAVPIPLQAEDEYSRYCIQLYHHVAGAVDIKGRDVLEVGCGRGGGADYVARYLAPAKMVGLDMVGTAVEFCRQHHATANLSFIKGDAGQLPFNDGSFDAVVNIESSHLYASMPDFLNEVSRILRPDGHLLIADFREADAIPKLRDQFHAAGFNIRRETIITRNVVRALELDCNRRMHLINTWIPRPFRKMGRQFAATPGTSYCESLRSGAWEYLSYVLQKRPPRA